jgi:multiple sugar transport system permease protein
MSAQQAVSARRRRRGVRKSPRSLARADSLTGAIFTLPAWLLVGAIGIFPLVAVVVLSLRSESLIGFLPTRYVGLANFHTDVFTSSFVHSVTITAIITAGGLLIQIPAGLGLAVLLQRVFPGVRIVRSVLLVPMMLTPVAVGLMWRLLLNADLGVVNFALTKLGFAPVNWLGSPHTALLSIVLVDSWQAIPFTMLMFLAGLASLPHEPFEAAQLDGGTPWQIFRYITLPLLTPVILVVLMIRAIEGAKLFDLIFILTGGGPGSATETLSVTTYHTAFQYFAISRGAALAVALTVVLAPLYVLWIRATR